MKFWRKQFFVVEDEIEIDVDKEWEEYVKDNGNPGWCKQEIEWEKEECIEEHSGRLATYICSKYLNRLPTENSIITPASICCDTNDWDDEFTLKSDGE